MRTLILGIICLSIASVYTQSDFICSCYPSGNSSSSQTIPSSLLQDDFQECIRDLNYESAQSKDPWAKRYMNFLKGTFPNLLEDINWKSYAFSAGISEILKIFKDVSQFIAINKEGFRKDSLEDLRNLIFKRMSFFAGGAGVGGVVGYISSGGFFGGLIGVSVGSVIGQRIYEIIYEDDIVRMKKLLDQDLLGGFMLMSRADLLELVKQTEKLLDEFMGKDTLSAASKNSHKQENPKTKYYMHKNIINMDKAKAYEYI